MRRRASGLFLLAAIFWCGCFSALAIRPDSLETRVGGCDQFTSGQTSATASQTVENAIGCGGCSYKTASGQAKFVNRDPLAEQGGINLYAYCGNNPIDLFDAMGLCPWWQDLWNALNNLADNLGDRIFGQDAAGYNPLYDPTNPNNLLNPLSPYYLNPNSFNDSPFLNGSTPPEPSIIPPNPAVDFTSGIYQPSEPSSLAIFGLGTSLVGGPVIAVLTAPAKAGTTVSLADGEASLVLMQDGQLVAQQPVASLMTHLDFAAQNGALTAEGGLAPGYWVGTVANVNGNIIALNSMTFYGNQMANADATIALRLVFH